MLNPMTVRAMTYPSPQYLPCQMEGAAFVRSMSYIQARNFLLADRDIPSVTRIGQIFDTILETAPAQAVLRTLDGWGRYIFDVCETTNHKVSKKRMNPALIVVLMSGYGSHNTLLEPNCTTEVAIKSIKNGTHINDTIELSLLHKGRCLNWGRESCVGNFYNAYFMNNTPSYELYNLNDTLGMNEWNHTQSSWEVSCKGQFELPSAFLRAVQKNLDQMIACEKKTETTTLIILGVGFGLPAFAILTLIGVKAINRFIEEGHAEYLMENPKLNYGSFK